MRRFRRRACALGGDLNAAEEWSAAERFSAQDQFQLGSGADSKLTLAKDFIVMIMRIFGACLLACLAVLAHAQGYGPLGGTSDQTVTVSISPRVKGLTFNTTQQRQEATFTVTAVAERPSSTYTWSGTGLTFDNIHAASTTAHAYAAGRFVANCSAVAGTGIKFVGASSLDCWAIGGPLHLGVVPPNNGRTPATPWVHDHGVSSQPFYLQYFYDPGTLLSDYMQQEQIGTVGCDGQPTGVTVTYTLGAALFSFDPLQNADPAAALQIYPTSQGTATSIRCVYPEHARRRRQFNNGPSLG